MLAQVKLKLKNAESSIAFMQEQHAKTLEGLHSEIQKLQKKNARLTFELAMSGPPSNPGVGKCGECKQLQEDLTASRAEILKLSSELTSREDKLKLYEHQLQDFTSKYAEEIKVRDERLALQNADVESKANTVASLTQQLYNTRIRLRREIETNARIASGAICKCQHCPIHNSSGSEPTPRSFAHHSKDSSETDVRVDPNPTRTSRFERRRNRTISSPIPESGGVPSIVDHTAIEHELTSGSRRLPTPPTLPRPSSNSSIRRASIPVRRQLPSMKSSVKEPTASTTSLPTGYNVDQRTLDLDPVRVYKYGTVPPDLRHLLRSRDSTEVHIVSKPAPPVLPPIQSDDITHSMSHMDIQYSEDGMQSSHAMGLEYGSYSELPTRVRPHRHRHFILAQAQGLSSAPSTMRVLRYNPHGLETGCEDVEGERGDEGDEDGAAEGTLLVRETVNRKDQTWQELHQRGTK